MSVGPKIGSLVLDQQYEILQQVKSSVGTGKTKLGTKGQCRYCRTTDSSQFRKLAHTFPESLGNKWIISLDECDDCNEKFSIYEDSLTKGVAPFLTLGGFVGKGNKTRQTGRTKGRSVIKVTLTSRSAVTEPPPSTTRSINSSGQSNTSAQSQSSRYLCVNMVVLRVGIFCSAVILNSVVRYSKKCQCLVGCQYSSINAATSSPFWSRRSTALVMQNGAL